MALPGLPYRSTVIDRAGLIGRDWSDWLQQIVRAIDGSAQRSGLSAVSGQGAALAAQTLVTAAARALFRVSFYLRITQAATVSSSATVTIRWTDGGVACAQAFAAVTGNTTATTQNAVAMVKSDQGTAITIEVAYASVGATAMQFAIDSRAESQP
jgi:hypothetical protein